ncbi:MAG: glutaredoxin [Oscillospiraceae bacterium]|jgi:glutaredoxin-related protein|nr:glutaredoxin [Oscillospiraceae bacterium]
MLKIYGSMLCPDCVQCREDLDKAGVEYEYLDFSENLKNLKEFLLLREGSLFDAIRAEGKIGIPCIQREDGSVTLDWEEFM